MPTAYDILKDKRAALLKQVGEIDAVLGQYAEIDRAAQRLISGDTIAPPVVAGDARVSEKHVPATPVSRATPIPEFEKHVRAVLEQAEQPMSRGSLLNVLGDRGVIVGGENEPNTLGTRLYRIAWVANLKGHGYWHALRDYAPAGYNAENR